VTARARTSSQLGSPREKSEVDHPPSECYSPYTIAAQPQTSINPAFPSCRPSRVIRGPACSGKLSTQERFIRETG